MGPRWRIQAHPSGAVAARCMLVVGCGHYWDWDSRFAQIPGRGGELPLRGRESRMHREEVVVLVRLGSRGDGGDISKRHASEAPVSLEEEASG
jgi:hypothetical protein